MLLAHCVNFGDRQSSASPALHLLLQVLYLLADVPSYRIGLANLGEESSYLVSAQEAGSPALQHVQETRFHHTYEKGREMKRWVLLSFGLPFGDCHLLTPTGQM